MELPNINHLSHDTRHTCANLLTEAEIPATTIKMILGHKGAMSMTEKVYTHLDVQVLIDAINKI